MTGDERLHKFLHQGATALPKLSHCMGFEVPDFQKLFNRKTCNKMDVIFHAQGASGTRYMSGRASSPQYGNKFRNIFNCASSQGGVERVYQFRFLCYFKSSWWIIRYYLRQGNKELIGDCSAESLHVYTKWISSSYLQGVVHITSQQLLIRDDVSKVSVTKIGDTGASMIMLLARGKI